MIFLVEIFTEFYGITLLQEKLQEDSGQQSFDDTPFIFFFIELQQNYVVKSNYLHQDAIVINS